MKVFRPIVLLALPVLCVFSVSAQKIISEGTFIYNLAIQTGNNEEQSKNPGSAATTTIYLKGNNSRTDMISPLGKEISIFNSKSDNAVILKEFSGQKLMITLTKENWKSKSKAYTDLKFELTNEVKTVSGFATKKAKATTKDGKSFVVYYSPDLQPSNKGYDAIFANLPGLPVEYEIEVGKTRFKYTLSKISYDPVQISMFDFPTSGYRVMTYEENQQLKRGN